MTILEEVLKANNRTVDQIKKIYHGKDNWCRCGCGGNYFYNGINKVGFSRAVNTLNSEKFSIDYPRITDIEAYEDFINIPYDPENNKCYTIYFD